MARRGARLSERTWVKLHQGYMKERSILGAAKYAGVSETTAAKYINEGDPDNGRPPIREMYEKARAKALDQFVGNMADEIGNTLKVLKGVQDAGFATLLRHIREGKRKTVVRKRGEEEVVFRTVEDVQVSPRSIVAAARELQKLMGGADKIIEIRAVEIADVMIQSMERHMQEVMIEYGVPLDAISEIARRTGEDVRRASRSDSDTVH